MHFWLLWQHYYKIIPTGVRFIVPLIFKVFFVPFFYLQLIKCYEFKYSSFFSICFHLFSIYSSYCHYWKKKIDQFLFWGPILLFLSIPLSSFLFLLFTFITIIIIINWYSDWINLHNNESAGRCWNKQKIIQIR